MQAAPVMPEPLVQCSGLVLEEGYGLAFLSAVLGLAAEATAGFGFQNLASALMYSSLT